MITKPVSYQSVGLVPHSQGHLRGETGAIFPEPQVPKLHYPHITVVIGPHILDLPRAPYIFLDSLGIPARSYCKFTDSNWVWLRAYLVLQFPDILK